MEQDEWKVIASQRQFDFYETLGSRLFDEIEKTDLFQLKKKIGFATCGRPSEMPNNKNYNTGYSEEQLVHIKSICDKVIEKSDNNPIRFSCTVLVLYHQKVICETPVFRIETKDGNIFIDANARVYKNWKLFLKNNKLPDCEYCYPVDGIYNRDKECLVAFAYSPASGFFNKTTSCLDTAGSVAAVAAAGVFALGTVVSVAPVAISVAGTTALCTGVYNVTRSVGSLYDRGKHEQSLGFKDQESRSAWFAIGSSAVGITQMAALKGAQKVVEGGKSLGKLGTFGLHALTASSLAFSGFGFVENLYICAAKYEKGIITSKDVFDLSCELLFLFNAIASAKATSQLVNNMNAAVMETPSSQKKLSRTQKRNLRKRAAKRRAKGLPVIATEESNTFSSIEFSGTLQLLLFEAVKAYSPRLQEILYTCQSIGHDIKCWRCKEISNLVFLKNSWRNLTNLYKTYKEEILVIVAKMHHFFISISDSIMQFINTLFETSSDKVKSIFCTKVLNAEDEIELLFNKNEEEIMLLHEDVQTDNNSVLDNNGGDESSNDDDLLPEVQNLLRCCGRFVEDSSWPCNNMEDFQDVFDSLKFVVLDEYSSKVSNYKLSFEAAKAAAGENFNFPVFHEKLGIKGDVNQHMFSETLKNVTVSGTMFKIKSKLKDIKKEKISTTTPVWGALTEGIFHYSNIPLSNSEGHLSHQEVLSVVNTVVKSTTIGADIVLQDENCSILEEKDIVMIDHPNLQILVYCEITEENTASGIIMVFESEIKE